MSASSSISFSSTCLSLTDDILLEIFTRLPLLNSIYQMKCLSKVWLSKLSDPYFMIKWFEINVKSLPLLRYHTITHHKSDKNPLRFRYAYPELHSEFMSRNDHLFSCKFPLNKKPFQGADVYLLGSSNGLVLCFTVVGSDSNDLKRYHVCNPLTQKWVSLPSPPNSEIGYYDVTGIFSESSSSFTSSYKVVRIPRFEKPSRKFSVDMFCSHVGVWKSIEVSCDEIVAWGTSMYENVSILNSVLFWIIREKRVLVYNINQKNEYDGHQCSLINLPDKMDMDILWCGDSCCIAESEGMVCYARIIWSDTTMKLNISVWVLNEVNWQILHKDISLDDIFAQAHSKIGDIHRIQVLGFSPVDHNVVFLGWWSDLVSGINLQTRSVEELCLCNNSWYIYGMSNPFLLKPMPTVLPSPSWIDT